MIRLYAKEWLREDKKGRQTLNALMKEWEEYPLEKIGAVIRRMSEFDERT